MCKEVCNANLCWSWLGLACTITHYCSIIGHAPSQTYDSLKSRYLVGCVRTLQESHLWACSHTDSGSPDHQPRLQPAQEKNETGTESPRLCAEMETRLENITQFVVFL